MGKDLSEAIFAAMAVLVLVAISAGTGTISAAIFLYGDASEPIPMLGAVAAAAFSTWIAWQAVATVPMTISLFHRTIREWRTSRKAAIAGDPRTVALRTGLLRLWIVGTITWLPIGFYLWQDGRSFDPVGLIAWVTVPPVAIFALGLGVRWAIAGFRPQADNKPPSR